MPADRRHRAHPPGPPKLEWVFVLKLSDNPAAEPLQGRVEHLVSGRELGFASGQELLQALRLWGQPGRH